MSGSGSDAERLIAEKGRQGSAGERWAAQQTVRKPKRGGKILSMRQLRKMTSTLVRRMYRDATSKELNPRDKKQCTVSYGVLVDKLVILAPVDRHGQVEDEGSPEIRAAMQDLGLRIAALTHNPLGARAEAREKSDASS